MTVAEWSRTALTCMRTQSVNTMNLDECEAYFCANARKILELTYHVHVLKANDGLLASV